MPPVALGPWPLLGPKAKFPQYREWLLEHFFYNLCSYCLLQSDSLEVDHYVPKSYDPSLTDAPSNLLLACSSCNGSSGKWDYHPKHAARKRCKDHVAGYQVIDVRCEDFADMFSVDESGEIRGREGSKEQDRANWNIGLLGLDRRASARRDTMRMLRACERGVAALDDPNRVGLRDVVEPMLNDLLPQLRQRALFFRVFGLRMSSALEKRLAELSQTGTP